MILLLTIKQQNKNKTTKSKTLKYKKKLIGRTPNNGYSLDSEVVVPLKYLSIFWRTLDLRLINCK